MNTNIIAFKDIGIADVPVVGGKNASLGEMYNQLTSKGVQIPNGFATTSHAFWTFIDDNSIRKPLDKLWGELDSIHYSNLKEVGKTARKLIMDGKLSTKFSKDIIDLRISVKPRKITKTIMYFMSRPPFVILKEMRINLLFR